MKKIQSVKHILSIMIGMGMICTFLGGCSSGETSAPATTAKPALSETSILTTESTTKLTTVSTTIAATILTTTSETTVKTTTETTTETTTTETTAATTTTQTTTAAATTKAVSSDADFVALVRKEIAGDVGDGEKISDVKLKNRVLTVSVNMGNGDSRFPIEDVALNRAASITDTIIELDRSAWDMVVIDFGYLGKVTKSKSEIVTDGDVSYFEIDNFD